MGIFDRLFGRKPSDISESDHAKPHRQDALTNGVTSPKHSWESLPEGFIVTDTETARQFFMACDGDYSIMTKQFPEVYESFQTVTDYKTRHDLTKEFAIKKFSSLLTGEEDNIPSVAAKVYNAARHWGMDFYDDEIIAKLTAVADLSNKRSPNTTDRFGKGYFYPESKFRERYPILLKYKSALAQTIAFYRNRNALEAFLNGCAYASGNYERQKALCKRFGDCFAYMRERIQDQSIKDTLNELLDSCEEVSPIIGIDQTAFYEPATEQDLQECEARTGIIIPLPMREFLMFSNGATLFENSTTIYAASEIGKYTLDGYDDENAKIYIPIGDFIGDGTAFVLNKTNGEVGEYDHETGEVTIYGDFEDFLGEIMEFHCQDYMD